MAEHQLTVRVSTEALRRALELVENGSHGSVDELVEALLIEAGEAGGNGRTSADPARLANGHAVSDGAAALVDSPPAALAAATPIDEELGFLTNRLSPLKLSVRVLANLANAAGEWPELGAFQSRAAAVAREVGLRLRDEDRAAGRKGFGRRFIGYPVGDNASAAIERFIYSFTLDYGPDAPIGPLAILGLATLVDDRPALTEAGWALAKEASPLLDGGEGTLSAQEAAMLRAALASVSTERDFAAEFIGAVRRAAGSQTRVDELLGSWHSDWSADHAAAHRAAMIGRLTDLGAIRVTGRGTNAQIELLDVEGLDHERKDESE